MNTYDKLVFMQIRNGAQKMIACCLSFVAMTPTVAGCSIFDDYEYDSSDPELPRFKFSQPASETVQLPKNLACKTNVIDAKKNTYSGNTIVDAQDRKVAVVAAGFWKGDNNDSDEVAFWIAPDPPDEPGSLGDDPWVTMRVEAESGKSFSYNYNEYDDFTAEVEIDGRVSDASADLSFVNGGNSGQDFFPVPRGFITANDRLKSVEIAYEGEELAQCVPAQGSSGLPEVEPSRSGSTPTSASGAGVDAEPKGNSEYDKYAELLTSEGVEFRPGASGTYLADVGVCERLSDGSMDVWQLATNEGLAHGNENARRIELMVPLLCPDNQQFVDEAKSGNVVQQRILDGNFVVATIREENGPLVVQPGTWQTTSSSVSDCYYERGDGAGNIIENNFVNFAQTLTVTILPSDGTFISTRCGGWERVDG